jgi:hypothetical protein
MLKRVSPAAAARRVLHSFPFPRVGAAISEQHVEDFFQRRNIPVQELVMGLRHAMQLGWVAPGALQTVVMMEAGMNALVKPPEVLARANSEMPSFSVEGG